MDAYRGAHPAIGALDVCPVVWFDPADREAARTEAVAVATQIGGLGVPVFLYGELARDPGRAERSYFRNGGLPELWLRMESGELRPDFGPELPHRSGGATLVTARPPLAAFNVELDSDDVEVARAVAAGLREAGGGPAGVRAIGLLLSGGRAQVSTNVHDPLAVPLGEVVAAGAGAGGAARRPPGRGGAGRTDPAGGARRLPAGGADPRLRPGPARDRAAAGSADRLGDHLDSPTWPRRRKSGAASSAAPRAAGSTTSRAAAVRAAARKPKPAPARNASRSPKQDLPPTWRGSFGRGAVAALIFAAVLALVMGKSLGVALLFGAFMMVFYVPAGYYIDTALWRRRERARIRSRSE